MIYLISLHPTPPLKIVFYVLFYFGFVELLFNGIIIIIIIITIIIISVYRLNVMFQ